MVNAKVQDRFLAGWKIYYLITIYVGNSTDHPALDGQEEQDAEPMHNSVTRSVTDVLEEPADLDNDEPTYSVTPLQDYDHYTQDHTLRKTTPYNLRQHPQPSRTTQARV